jgi:hypothetical protein
MNSTPASQTKIGESPDVFTTTGTYTIHAPNSGKPLCEICKLRPAEKTDYRSREVCLKCASPKIKPIRLQGRPVGRNERCPCGSGKKFKKCACSAKARAEGKQLLVGHMRVGAGGEREIVDPREVNKSPLPASDKALPIGPAVE